MPVASHKWGALTYEQFKAWVDAGGPAARHEVMRVTGKGKSTVSTWVIGRCAPPPEQQEAILALMRDPSPHRAQPAGSLPLERQRAAQRAAGLAKRPPAQDAPLAAATPADEGLERALERALARVLAGGAKERLFGQFDGAPVLGVVPVVVTIRVEDARTEDAKGAKQ